MFNHDKIPLSLPMVIEGLFSAGACMITFGALLGKTSAGQLLVLSVIEVAFYTLNIYIIVYSVEVVDVGGSMIIHMFGALFGIAATRFLTPCRKDRSDGWEVENRSSATSDVFAMIGTVFLWILWPSFNAALVPPLGQYRAVVNTILSLCNSCLTAYAMSRFFDGKFGMVDIQNAVCF